ncbi:hypothetical protein [Mesorhizobium sp.]|uniref:hypothetical protein n=1 Tax=Mesorhizobium sp. TaxID=1871066 RepID=UPI0025800012|nr:hypothetical protein [Mesorhizobium sp.]
MSTPIDIEPISSSLFAFAPSGRGPSLSLKEYHFFFVCERWFFSSCATLSPRGDDGQMPCKKAGRRLGALTKTMFTAWQSAEKFLLLSLPVSIKPRELELGDIKGIVNAGKDLGALAFVSAQPQSGAPSHQ